MLPVISESTALSEVELRADLADARIARAADQTEAAAGSVPVRPAKLSVVENVKELGSNLDNNRFGDRNPLLHAEIGIDDSRAVEEPLARRAESSQGGIEPKGIRQEI